jgi:hypothetical protein
MNDDDLRALLEELDESDEDVTSWEAEFIENVCYNYRGPLSERQREVAEGMLEKYDMI